MEDTMFEQVPCCKCGNLNQPNLFRYCPNCGSYLLPTNLEYLVLLDYDDEPCYGGQKQHEFARENGCSFCCVCGKKL